MRRCVGLAILVSAAAAHGELTATLEANRVTVRVNEKVFTSYVFAKTQKYPYFYPVNGPASGRSVTTESSEPYPHHHSLFFGCDRVNDANFWQEGNELGQIVSQGPKLEKDKGEQVVFTDVCLWRKPGSEPVLRDERRVTLTAPTDALRIIEFEITLVPLVDISIEKTNHSLFSARMVPELAVTAGGVLVNAEGARSEAGTFGVASPWCDYSGLRDGIAEGLAILQHPSNRWYPSRWFTRDYGFFSPTPMYWPEGDATRLQKNEKVTLRYRVLVHAGDATAADVVGLFTEYQGSQ